MNSPSLILIVDDTPTNLDAISETLSDAGYDIAIATSGERALQNVRRRPPDLILLDVMMPGLDGFAICQHLKAEPQTCDIPVIFMTAIADADSKIKGFDSGAVDYITKPFNEREVLVRVKTHLQLRQLQQNLEREVAKKTADLQAAKEAAEAANRAKTTFLATIGHELRTPLNSILGITEGLQTEMFGAIPERQLNPLQTIERSSKHLLASIEDLLDATKIGTSKIELNPQPISVDRLCKSSFDAVRLPAAKKKIQFEANISPHLPELMVDERRIRQALIEILTNAVKFNRVGGKVKLDVSLISKCSIRIATIDTGIGIAAENMPRLFQSFNQLDNSLDRAYEGMGIGLALVKHWVECHHGSIEVWSELGQGTCVTIDLPIATPMPVTASNSSNRDLDFSSAEPGTILFVDNDRANVATMTAYLESRGYHLLIAKDAPQAISMATTHHPDLMVVNVRATFIDGMEATLQLRQIPESAQLPIIALTDSNMSGERQNCLDAGASICISKPFNFSQLVVEIKTLIESSASDLSRKK